MSYFHTDFDRARTFFLDFGMETVEETDNVVYFRGYGPEPFIYRLRRAPPDAESSFDGAAYVVQSREELERAHTVFGASLPCQLSAPGGGEFVALTDPCGFKIYLVHGQREGTPLELDLNKLTVNYEDFKPRKGQFQRFKPGPAPVYRWGHYGVTYSPEVGYQTMYDFYTKTIGLASSDIVQRHGMPITCFFQYYPPSLPIHAGHTVPRRLIFLQH